MPAIVYSTEDPASSNIASILKENHGFQQNSEVDLGGKRLKCWSKGEIKLIEVNVSPLETEFLGELETDLIVFASKHKSASGKPCFTVHATGNWGSETMAGNPSELQLTSARALQAFFDALSGKEMPVFQEATHHGPTSLKSPSVFFEIGSTENEWLDKKLGEIAADAILLGCDTYSSKKVIPAIGFGGTHYCTSFKNLDYALSHVASKHALPFVNEEMIVQAVEKTVEKVEMALVDEKNCNKMQKELFVSTFRDLNLDYEFV